MRIGSKYSAFLVLIGFFLFLCYNGFCLKKPSESEKKEISQLMEYAKLFQSGYDMCKAEEAKARKAGNTALADAWLKQADKYYDLAKEYGEKAVHMTDEEYEIDAPPGTTFIYDPACTDYAYVPKPADKSVIEVVICPEGLKDGPGLLASTKIHELVHAWHVYFCYSSLPGFYTQCNLWQHWTEFEAYSAEEKAYDSCVTSDMPPEEKTLVKDRAKAHQKAMKTAPYTAYTAPSTSAKAGTTAVVPFVVHNPSGNPLVVDLTFTDEKGWTIIPSSITGITIQPEETYNGAVDVVVPVSAAVRDVDPLRVLAESGPTTGTDINMVYIPPTCSVSPGNKVYGSRGETVDVEFPAVNNDTITDTFTIAFTNPLGWSTTPLTPSVTLAPSESTVLRAAVTIPVDVATTFATNLVFCTMTSNSNPAQTDKKFATVVVKDNEISCLTIVSPLGTLESGEVATPKTKVKNSGHVESFFDVFFEIERSGVPETSDVVNVSGLLPGEEREISFNPVSFTTPGIYTTRAYIVLPADAFPEDNETVGTFEVLPLLGVPDWLLL